MNSRRFLHRRGDWGALLPAALAVALLTLPRTVAAFCWGPTVMNPDIPTFPVIPDRGYYFDQQTSFWSVFAAMPFEETDDGDIELYSYQDLSGTQPYCLNGYITNSQNGAGRTDFIIGDFNFNSLGGYYPRVFCYSGACNDNVDQWNGTVWRPGEFMFVDFPPTTVSFGGGNPVPGDRIIKVWDVFLSVGTTYNFRFTSTMGTDAKMLLFRNTVAGTYFAGRNSAEFEVTGCTNYTALSTGYYGLVVVLDRWTTGSYTVGVTTLPSCACADSLAPDTPVTAVPSFGEERRHITPRFYYWNVVGIRAPVGHDWDLEIGDGNAGGDGPGCQANVLASSTSGFGADIVVADFNHVAPGDLAVRAYRYSGYWGPSIEWDTGSAAYDQTLFANGPQVAEAWSANDVVKIWDVGMTSAQTYTFQFYNPGGNFRVLLFRNPSNGAYYAGGTQAVVNTTGDFSYTAPTTGYYGVVVLKNDDNPGTFALRVGTCATPATFTAMTPQVAGNVINYAQIAPTTGSWTVAGIRCVSADWDIFQYGNAPGSWPDCFSPMGAASEASSGVDFVVGDFHYNSPGTYNLRLKQFSGGFPEFALAMWTGEAMKLGVNQPAAEDTMPWTHPLHAWEAYLVDGAPYELRLTQPAGGALKAFVFQNPTSGPYWAPRSARMIETSTTGSFVAPNRGWYGIVVTNEMELDTPYTLQLVTVPTAVDETKPHYETALAGSFPNPARSDFSLHYTLAQSAHVAIEILDLAGRRVADIDEGERGAGEWSVSVRRRRDDGTRLPAGVYFARLQVDGKIAAMRKVSLVD